MKKIVTAFFVMVTILLCSCQPMKNKPNEYSESFFAMDTICTVRAGGENAEYATKEAINRIKEIEKMTAYYSDSSEVALFNNAPDGVPIAVSEDMLCMLKTSLEICKASEGAFDITLAPLKDLWNIQDGEHQPPGKAEIDEALSCVGYEKLMLNEAEKTLTKTEAGVRLDLGAVAKGYATDCAIEVLQKNGADYAIIDLGGNIGVFGRNDARPDGSWLVGIQKPYGNSGEYLQTVSLFEGCVVTAGTYQRYFEWKGKKYHHIMNSKTGYPADSGVVSASIRVKSALVADCISTACVVLGEQEGQALAEKYNCEVIYCKN